MNIIVAIILCSVLSFETVKKVNLVLGDPTDETAANESEKQSCFDINLSH
jgi:hypothetical protein